MKKYLILFGVFGLIVSIASCGRMNDIHDKYRNETIYSGKVSNLRGYAGIEKVYLAWDNPVDYKSKSILIEYYAYEDTVYQKLYDDVFENGRLTLDSTVIDGLVHDAAYTFNVYTLDIDSNKSIKVSIPVTPMTRKKAESSNGYVIDYAKGHYSTWSYTDDKGAEYSAQPTEGRVVFFTSKSKSGAINVEETFITPISNKGNVTFKISNLTNTWSKWAGGVGYSLKEVNGRVIAKGQESKLPLDSVYVKYAGTSREQKVSYDVDYYCFMSEEDLTSDVYVVDYSVVGYPISGASPLYDTCTVKGSDPIELLLENE